MLVVLKLHYVPIIILNIVNYNFFFVGIGLISFKNPNVLGAI